MWAEQLKKLSTFFKQQTITQKKFFISYAWEGDGTSTQWLQDDLKQIQDSLQGLGSEVFFDLSAMGGKSDIAETMRAHLAESDTVLAICTPQYCSRVQQQPDSNVGYEYQQTLKKLKEDNQRVVPLWLAGSKQESIPKALLVVPAIDMRDTYRYERNFLELLLPRLYPELTGNAEYKALCQGYLAKRYSGKLPGLLPVLQRCLSAASQESDTDGFWPMIQGQDKPQSIDRFLDMLATSDRAVHLVHEQFAAYRQRYWVDVLHAQWDRLVFEQGVLPIYIPLNQIALDSRDIIEDYLKSKQLRTVARKSLQQHFTLLLILAGYEHRIHHKELDLLKDCKWHDWRCQTIVLSDKAQEDEAKFLQSYLRSQQHAPALTYETTYAEYQLSAEEQVSVATARSTLKPQQSVQEAKPSEKAVALSDEQIKPHWQMLLAQIAKLSPNKPKLYLSQIEDKSIAVRITVLQQSLLAIGCQWVSDIEQADSIIAITSPAYLKASKNSGHKAHGEYQTILALAEKGKGVFPLWFAGDSFASSVPGDLFKYLVRDCRDAVEDYYQWGSLHSPLGLLPALLDIRQGTEVGSQYQQHWHDFSQAVWGKQGQPSGLLHKLKLLSRQYAKQETLYQSTKRYYQDPYIKQSKEGENIGQCDAFINELLQQAKTPSAAHPVHLLFAGPGSGKSMVLLRLEENLWQHFHRYHLIPIRIPLNQIIPSDNNFIGTWLTEKAKYTADELTQLKRQYRFMLLLDGYDEFVFSYGDTHNILTLSGHQQFSGVTILTCRTQLEQSAGRYQAGQRRYIAPFNPSQIDAYLTAQAKNKKELTPELRAKVHTLPGLIELIANPLMLYIMTDILPDLAKTESDTKLTRYDIYERFTNKWFLREFVRAVSQGLLKSVRLGQAELQHQLLNYAEHIAIMMFRQEKLQIADAALDAQANALLKNSLIDDDEHSVLHTFRSACPLKIIGTQYQFIHKSFQEFLVAQHLLKALPLRLRYIKVANRAGQAPQYSYQHHDGFLYDTKDGDNFQAKLQHLESNVWSHVELRKEPAVLDFLREVQPNRYRLLQIIGASKGVIEDNVWQGNPKVAQASGNAMTLAVYCQYSLAGLNFDHTQIRGADIGDGLLTHSSIRHADWQEVNAQKVQLTTADISHSNYLVDFGETTFLTDEEFKLGKPFCFAHSPIDENVLAVGYSKWIVLWDLQRKIILKRFFIKHDIIIFSLSYYPDGKDIFFMGGLGTFGIWDSRLGRQVCIMNIPQDKYSVPRGLQQAPSQRGDLQYTRVNDVIIVTYRACHWVDPRYNGLMPGKKDTLWHISIKAWNVRSGKQLKNFEGCTYHMRFVADSEWLVASFRNALTVWSISSGKRLRGFEKISGEVVHLKGDELMVKCTAHKMPVLKLWNIRTAQLVKVFSGHNRTIYSVKRVGNQFISLAENEAKLWNINTAECIQTYRWKTHSYTKSFVWKSNLLFIVADINILLFNVHNGKLLKIIHIEELGTESYDNNIIFWSYANNALIIGKRKGIKLYSIPTYDSAAGQDIIFDDTNKNSCALVVGDHLYLGKETKKEEGICVELWDIKKNKLVRRYIKKNEQATDHSPDYKVTCIVYRANSVEVFDKHTHVTWDANSGRCTNFNPEAIQGEIHCVLYLSYKAIIAGPRFMHFFKATNQRVTPHKKVKVEGTFTCISGNEEQFIVGFQNNSDKKNRIELWSSKREEKIRHFGMPQKELCYITFHPNNQWIVSIDKSGLLLVFDKNTGSILARQQWMSCETANIDFRVGRLVLVNLAGKVFIAQVPYQFYWNEHSPIPPWQLERIDKDTERNIEHLKIEKAKTSSDNVSLFQAHGAEGEPIVRDIMPVKQSQIRILALPNTFFDIHCYLVKKQIEKPSGFGKRFDDFTSILKLLQQTQSSDALSKHIVARHDFHHRNPLAGNRYYELINRLESIPENLRTMYFQTYIVYINHAIPIEATDIIPPTDLGVIESLRQKIHDEISIA